MALRLEVPQGSSGLTSTYSLRCLKVTSDFDMGKTSLGSSGLFGTSLISR
jgi:hypothetical protein